MRTLDLILMALLPATAAGQVASYTYIDQQAPYKNRVGLPSLTALNLPRIGTTLQLQLAGSESNRTYVSLNFLATGLRNPNFRIDVLGGHLYTSAEIVTYVGRCGGSTCTRTITFTIPNSSQLLGVHFYQQVLNRYQLLGSPTSTFRLYRGGHGVIGK